MSSESCSFVVSFFTRHRSEPFKSVEFNLTLSELYTELQFNFANELHCFVLKDNQGEAIGSLSSTDVYAFTIDDYEG